MIEFFKENRNIIIFIMIIVILYLLLQTNLFRTIKKTIMVQWYNMSNTTKLLLLFIIMCFAYYFWE